MEETFTLSVEPAGAATLSQTSVTLAAGASSEITLTPTADSAAPNDVHIVAMQGSNQVGTEDMTIARVTFPQQIRNEPENNSPFVQYMSRRLWM